MIAYVRRNTSRKPEFMVRTEIVRENGDLNIRKMPRTDVAASFVNGIAKKYQLFQSEADRLPFGLARVEKSLPGIVVEYVQGIPLSSLLVRAAQEQDAEHFRQLLDQYAGLILEMPTRPAQAHPLLNELGLDQLPGPHIWPGCLDLNAANFIQQRDGRFVLFDYEWTLDVPVPRMFVLFWGLIALYEEIAYLGPNALVPLKSLYQKLGVLPHFDALTKATHNMYAYVHDEAHQESFDGYVARVRGLEVDRPFTAELDNLKKQLQLANEQERVLRWEIEHRDEQAGLQLSKEQGLEKTVKELEWITRSKTWKTRNFIVGMLRRVTKR
jgi:hypothetical protein